MALIIVESPTKARTFNRILKGKNYYVYATLGHIRDLPKNKIAIDYTKEFKPEYEIIPSKRKVVEQLKKLAQKNDEIIFATDPDREGESIAYHAAYLLGLMKEEWPELQEDKKKKIVKRIIFHEITPRALQEALKQEEHLRLDLIKAQQTRRILDRIVGYELSPLLWVKLGKNWLSAGRVQTVALRLVVEREKEIQKFVQEKYFQIYGLFKNSEDLRAKLIKKGSESLIKQVKITLFAGEYTYTKTTIDDTNVEKTVLELKTDAYKIEDIQENIAKRYPPPPFTTSLLQQEAAARYGFTAKMVMRLAQDLYERGLITYHRTDSFNLSSSFLFGSKDYVLEKFGKAYIVSSPRVYKTRSKSAQEAHEAIRPTKLEKDIVALTKDRKMTKNHRVLYELIFNRALATQMKEAEIKEVKIMISGKKEYIFEAESQLVIFDGFLRVLNPTFSQRHQESIQIKKNEQLKLMKLESEEKYTLPPPRYSEATLIKALEEREIGRPSTYAPIISLIQEKGYTEKESYFLKPTNLGSAISDYLSSAFPKVFDIDFTASMEQGLDDIAKGEKNMLTLLADFYKPFKENLDEKKSDKEKIKVDEEVSGKCPTCGNPLILRFSRYGKFYACSTYPKCKFTKSFLKEVKGKVCPKCEGKIVIRHTKKGRRFFGCENYPKCTFVEFSYKKL